MYGNKSIWASTTVWGGIVALLAGIAAIFGVTISEADQSILTEALLGISSALGGIIAIWGRIRATKQIGK
jgi:hypothetical protein